MLKLGWHIAVTDESQSVELAGYQPRIIEARDPLLKLTHRSDLPIIEALINQRERQVCA